MIICEHFVQEIRTYNCRAAEGRPALTDRSKSSMSQVGSIDEVVVVSTPGQVTSTRDVYFSKAMNEMNRTRCPISINYERIKYSTMLILLTVCDLRSDR